jgi:hypothetical protein
MKLVGDTNPLRSQVRAAFLEHREHRRVILFGHRRRVALQRSDARCSGGIDDIRLAAAAPRQLTHARGRVLGTSNTVSPRATSH